LNLKGNLWNLEVNAIYFFYGMNIASIDYYNKLMPIS